MLAVSAEAMSLVEFEEIVAEMGWFIGRTAAGQKLFENGKRSFRAWEQGGAIGAESYPTDLQTVIAFYEEGTPAYYRVAGA